MKHITTATFLCSIAISIAACSSASKSGTTTPPGADASAIGSTSSDLPPVAVPSNEEISERYGLKELDSIANALKVVFDQSLAGQNDKQGEAVLGCVMKGDEARRLLMPLKALMDSQTAKEREQYIADPKTFARDKGFETCASSCICGAYAMVLEPVSPREIKKANLEIHNRYMSKLQAKAAIQGPDASFACAKKQNWFCRSDLRAYLEREANNSGF
jgi:hypothetical protein